MEMKVRYVYTPYNWHLKMLQTDRMSAMRMLSNSVCQSMKVGSGPRLQISNLEERFRMSLPRAGRVLAVTGRVVAFAMAYA